MDARAPIHGSGGADDYRRAMRLCARAGCGESAVATVAFDSQRQMVELDRLGAPASAQSRGAGDLCERHAARLVAPRGWHLLDLRGPTPTLWAQPRVDGHGEPAPARARRRPPAMRRRAPQTAAGDSLLLPDRPTPEPAEVGDDVGDDVGDETAAVVVQTAEVGVETEPTPDSAGWSPRFDPDDDLDGLLRPTSPLLARAFRTQQSG